MKTAGQTKTTFINMLYIYTVFIHSTRCLVRITVVQIRLCYFVYILGN